MGKEYTYVTYGVYQNFIPEGFYSIIDVEDILSAMKQMKSKLDECLKNSMAVEDAPDGGTTA